MKQNQQKEFLITKFTLDLNGVSKPLFFEANSDHPRTTKKLLQKLVGG